MAYTVFFKEQNQIYKAETFINDQAVGHRQLLTTIAEELSAKGTTSHAQANKNSKGEWTIVLNDNGDAYIYAAYVSKLELPDTHTQPTPEPEKTKTLVIIDPMGARDSVGGYHPGYWTVEDYVALLNENQREAFMQTVAKIRRGIPSEDYSVEGDGEISIHVNRKEKNWIIYLSCRARWM